ncbi:hypothetical protein V6N13_043236 [Hibiscus sabdariffa]|uniref:Uncharacterized protein n=1 Tax=Hibiscus sabdariffa TaxID=183260 RepID=A0ABR2G2N8_9ROSI
MLSKENSSESFISLLFEHVGERSLKKITLVPVQLVLERSASATPLEGQHSVRKGRNTGDDGLPSLDMDFMLERGVEFVGGAHTDDSNLSMIHKGYDIAGDIEDV